MRNIVEFVTYEERSTKRAAFFETRLMQSAEFTKELE
jgi:hypothetical protein